MEHFYYESKPVIWVVFGLGLIVLNGISFLPLAVAIGLFAYAINISILRRNYRKNVFLKAKFINEVGYLDAKYPKRTPQSRVLTKQNNSENEKPNRL